MKQPMRWVDGHIHFGPVMRLLTTRYNAAKIVSHCITKGYPVALWRESTLEQVEVFVERDFDLDQLSRQVPTAKWTIG